SVTTHCGSPPSTARACGPAPTCSRSPTRSAAARRTSSATSWASGCSASRGPDAPSPPAARTPNAPERTGDTQMDLLPTEEQHEIITTVRSQLERDFDLHALAERDGETSVVDRALWGRCAELGWFGLGLTESLGGVGYSLAEEALL